MDVITFSAIVGVILLFFVLVVIITLQGIINFTIASRMEDLSSWRRKILLAGVLEGISATAFTSTLMKAVNAKRLFQEFHGPWALLVNMTSLICFVIFLEYLIVLFQGLIAASFIYYRRRSPPQFE